LPIIPTNEREYVKHVFATKLVNAVVLAVYTTSKPECKYCKETEDLVEDLRELSGGKITVYKQSMDSVGGAVSGGKFYGAPALKIMSSLDDPRNVRFFGIPAGYEFGALIDDIIDMFLEKVKGKLEA